ncbi:MAG: TetR family transcriptional regulator [Bdellovibrionales bacterium]|nr:TetR family transcriptional regulator [Bdellovibrionales bacterium]
MSKAIETLSHSTPERILNAAEKLFAENGISTVSIRSIVEEAGVNVALVNYHFGSKDELVSAVIKRRLSQINKKRFELLDFFRQKNKDKKIPLKDLLYAFLSPSVELGQDKESGGQHFFRVVARAHAETAPHIQKVMYEELDDVIHIFLTELKKTLPNLKNDEYGIRLAFIVGAMFQAVLLPLKPGFIDRFFKGKYSDKKMLSMLLDFCEGGFNA